MKTLSTFLIGLCLLLLAGSLACRGSKAKTPEVAKVAQDTMLLRDLAEANKNTATAAAMDNSLNTVRTSVVARPPAGSSQALTSGTRSSQNDSARQAGATTSSGDPCASPAPVDQRSCLNRSIVQNDADLNRIYQDLLAQSRKSGGPELEERLRQSQREWVNTRDNECTQQTSGQGGALWARARGRCLADYSTRRTAELQRNLNSLRGQ
jgi:uncharacterized protein YecT (DUF1311 family)